MSYAKSEIFCCNVENPLSLAFILNIKLGKLPMRYLGVPLITKKLKEVDYKSLADQMTARISSWTAQYLSYAGKLQLISLVLSSMYNYRCSIFWLPKKSLEKLRNS